MQKYLPLTALAVATCYASSAYASGTPVSISDQEASAFERSLLAQATALKEPQPIYTQPVNKVEACKLRTSQDQLERRNFRAYWDGECKNGFAFGLGRDISLSDTHHMEEITIHNGTALPWSLSGATYNFLDNTAWYFTFGAKFPEMTTLSESYFDSVQGFDVITELAVTDALGNRLSVASSPFKPNRVYMNQRLDAPISYKFSDNSAAPMVDPNASTFLAEIFDTRSQKFGDYYIAGYPNRTVQHFRNSGGTVHTPVTLPSSYTSHIQAKYQAISDATAQAHLSLQKAATIEREYLFKACNGKSGIKGLDNATYTKICKWRDQFKVPYATASANYQRQLATMQQQAVTAGQQQQIQQQIAMQQQIANQQQALQQRRNSQASSDAGEQILESSGDFLRNATQSTYNWQPPAVQPITPPGGNNVTCYTIGRITRCR